MAFDPEAAAGQPIAPRWPVAGKAILYAPERFEMPPHDPLDGADPQCSIHFADLPVPGEVVERGWPVLTILAVAESPERCLAQLRERAERVQSIMFGRQPGARSGWYSRLDDPDAD